MTGSHDVKIYGNGIHDKHTHDEAYPYIGPHQVTVIIRGDIAEDFRSKYGVAMSKVDYFMARVELMRNDERIRECQYPFLAPSHLIGNIATLDDIVYEKKQAM